MLRGEFPKRWYLLFSAMSRFRTLQVLVEIKIITVWEHKNTSMTIPLELSWLQEPSEQIMATIPLHFSSYYMPKVYPQEINVVGWGRRQSGLVTHCIPMIPGSSSIFLYCSYQLYTASFACSIPIILARKISPVYVMLVFHFFEHHVRCLFILMHNLDITYNHQSFP